MLPSRTSRLARLTVLGALAATAWTAPAAVASEPAPATIAFQAATAVGDRYSRETTGTFAMTGPFADAGAARTSLRFAGGRIHGTAILIGDRGVFTVALRGASSMTVDGRQWSAGRWRVCGGTGAYRHLHGHGRWEADADVGALTGRLYRGAPATG